MDLIAGHGEALWPRPGRVFAASRSHTFAQLAAAIDDAFARWDRSHLHEFTRAKGYRLGILSDEDYDPEHLLDYRRFKLGRLTPASSSPTCSTSATSGSTWPRRIDPLETLGIVTDQPLPYFGWGDILDQYQRRWGATTARAHPRVGLGIRTRICRHSFEAGAPSAKTQTAEQLPTACFETGEFQASRS